MHEREAPALAMINCTSGLASESCALRITSAQCAPSIAHATRSSHCDTKGDQSITTLSKNISPSQISSSSLLRIHPRSITTVTTYAQDAKEYFSFLHFWSTSDTASIRWSKINHSAHFDMKERCMSSLLMQAQTVTRGPCMGFFGGNLHRVKG